MRLVLVSTLAAMVVAVSGCSTSESDDDQSRGAYYADIKAAAKDAKTDFERGVLSDGVITRAEYEEAVQRLVACAKDHDTTIIPEDHYGIYNYAVPGGDPDDVMGICSDGNTVLIESLYSQSVSNPDRRDRDELEAACLVRTGLAPAGFTVRDLRLANAKAQERGGDATHVFPFDTDDERWNQCISNPSYK